MFGINITRGVQKVRGPTKKENEFYDETRCEGCDVSKTIPDAVTSQSVSVAWLRLLVVVKMFAFFGTQRRSAGSSDSIRGVTKKCRKGYP